MALDLNGVLGAIGAAQAQARDTATRLTTAYGAQSQATADSIDATSRIGEANSIISSQAEQGALAAQRDTRIAATEFGTNMGAPNEIVTQIGRDMRASYEEARAQQERVAKVNQAATLGNPVGLIYDIFFGDEERAKLDAATQRFDLAANTLQTLNALTQQTAQTNLAIAETKSEATVAAELDKIEAQTALAKNELRSRLAGVDIQMLGALDTLNARQASLAVQAYNLGVQEEQRQWLRSTREAENEIRQATAKAAETTLNYYKAGLRSQGLDDSTVTMADFLAAKDLDRNRTSFLVSMGHQLESGSGVVRYGADPLSALGTVQANRVRLPPAQNLLGKALDAIAAETTDEAKVAQTLGMDRVSVMTGLRDRTKQTDIKNGYITKRAQEMLSNINPLDETNIYAPPPLDALANKTELVQNPFLRDLVAPRVEAGGNTKWNPSEMLSSGAKAIADGTHTSTQVAEGISWIANQFILMNDSTKNYLGFGVPAMSTLGKFNSTVSVAPGEFSTPISATIDLADPVQVSGYLQRVIRSKSFRDIAVSGTTEQDRAASPLLRLLDPFGLQSR